VKHFIMLMFSFVVWGTVGVLAGNSAVDLVVATMTTFITIEAADWGSDRFIARRRRWRR